MNRGDKTKIKQREQAIFNFKESVIEALDLGATLEELSNALNSLHSEMNPPPKPEPIEVLKPKEQPVSEILTFGEKEKPNFATFFTTGEGPSPNVLLDNISIKLINIMRRNTEKSMDRNAGQLLSLQKQSLMEMKGFGPANFKELKTALIEKGYQKYCPETHWIHEKD